MTTKIITKKLKGNDRHWRNFLDKNYLGSHNLERGEEMLLTIEKFVGEEEVKTADGKASNKPVLYFKEESPKMILNITNANTISALYGTHPDGWIGKQIQVYAASVRAFGKTQDALRIRDFVPKIAVDIVFYAERLSVAKNQQELKDIWTKFPVSARNDANLISQKDALKAKLS
ncbi:MAG: hypothetical protein PHU71_06875 [Candidatus Gracilibacteria bacterium]|nr:hypothetical protein [Candidatus Gracilibacteria bacterium]